MYPDFLLYFIVTDIFNQLNFITFDGCQSQLLFSLWNPLHAVSVNAI